MSHSDVLDLLATRRGPARPDLEWARRVASWYRAAALVLVVVALAAIVAALAGCAPLGPSVPAVPPTVAVSELSGTARLAVDVCAGELCAAQSVRTEHVAINTATGAVVAAEFAAGVEGYVYCHVADVEIDPGPVLPSGIGVPRLVLHVSHGASAETHALCAQHLGATELRLESRRAAPAAAGLAQ